MLHITDRVLIIQYGGCLIRFQQLRIIYRFRMFENIIIICAMAGKPRTVFRRRFFIEKFMWAGQKFGTAALVLLYHLWMQWTTPRRGHSQRLS